MKTHTLLASLAVAMGCAANVAAQGYPTKPVHIVVTSQPGGVLDITTRLVAPKLSEGLGQPVVVENRAGAEGIIGTEYVARAAPDGYMLLAVFDYLPLTQYLVKNVPYDAIKDFAPISLFIRSPMILAVSNGLGTKDLKSFLQLAKARGNLNIASAGIGSPSHLAAELLKSVGGINAVAVHYKGGAPAVNDLIGGHVDFMIAPFGLLLSPIKAGKLVPLAVTAPKKVALLPGLPPIAEVYPGFEAQSYVGLATPTGTPGEIIRRLNAESNKALADRELRERFESGGNEVVGGPPEVLGKWIAEQSEKWGRVIREHHITQD